MSFKKYLLSCTPFAVVAFVNLTPIGGWAMEETAEGKTGNQAAGVLRRPPLNLSEERISPMVRKSIESQERIRMLEKTIAEQHNLIVSLTREKEQREAAAQAARLVALSAELGLALTAKDEAVYRRFLNGKLIYRPNPQSDVGKIELPIANLKDAQGRLNPLEGTFDLSVCLDPDVANYLSISTGYRKAKNPANDDRYEIWLAPRFLVAANVQGSAKHYHVIMGKWDAEAAPVGLFCNWGYEDKLGPYDYLTTNSMEELGNNNLYKKWYGKGSTYLLQAFVNFMTAPPQFLEKISFCF